MGFGSAFKKLGKQVQSAIAPAPVQKVVDKVTEVAKPVTSKVESAFSPVVSPVADLAVKAGSATQGAFDRVAKNLENVAAPIAKPINSAAGATSGAFNSAARTAERGFSNAVGQAQQAARSAQEVATEQARVVADAASEREASLTKMLEDKNKAALAALSKYAVKPVAQVVKPAIVPIQNAANPIKDFVQQNVVSPIVEQVKPAARPITGGALATFQAASTVTSGASTAFSNPGASLATAMPGTPENSAFQSANSSVMNGIGDAAKPIIQAFGEIVDIIPGVKVGDKLQNYVDKTVSTANKTAETAVALTEKDPAPVVNGPYGGGSPSISISSPTQAPADASPQAPAVQSPSMKPLYLALAGLGAVVAVLVLRKRS